MFKDSKKVKGIRNYVYLQSVSVFLDIVKCADFGEKMLMSAELKEWVT